MILHPQSDEEFEDIVALLRVINVLRQRGPGYQPPLLQDTPWIQTRWARPCYL